MARYTIPVGQACGTLPITIAMQQQVPALTTRVLLTETLHASPIPTVKTAYVIVQTQASTLVQFTPQHVALKMQNFSSAFYLAMGKEHSVSAMILLRHIGAVIAVIQTLLRTLTSTHTVV